MIVQTFQLIWLFVANMTQITDRLLPNTCLKLDPTYIKRHPGSCTTLGVNYTSRKTKLTRTRCSQQTDVPATRARHWWMMLLLTVQRHMLNVENNLTVWLLIFFRNICISLRLMLFLLKGLTQVVEICYSSNASLYPSYEEAETSSGMVLKLAGLILGLRQVNERRRYLVTTSLIVWLQTWNRPWS